MDAQLKRSRSTPVSQVSRTQHKLLLQRQSFLADDKDYLEFPANMRRLTKELDRVNREYRCVRYFEDPLVASFRRVTTTAAGSSISSEESTSWSSTSRLFKRFPKKWSK
ncbi:hypothetical protein DFQ30_007235 [Apophysomyces sp. BC1015]|nr:hypothetical protein DFQ30_007235 [Apophysomyces sp. BC1015]